MNKDKIQTDSNIKKIFDKQRIKKEYRLERCQKSIIENGYF